jgi:hypothetical protein
LVRYLLAKGGPAKFATLVSKLRNGRSTDDALKSAYGADARAIAGQFISAMKR